MERLRVLVADDDDAVRSALAHLVESLGHEVVAQARDGLEAVALTQETSPTLLLLDIRMPRCDGLEAAKTILHQTPVAIVIVTAYADETLMDQAAEVGVFSYLVKPVTRERLAAAISTARARFADLQVLRQEVGTLQQALEARKLIERAKGIVMRDLGVTEQDAYRWLKRTSSLSNQPIVEVARRVVALETQPTA